MICEWLASLKQQGNSAKKLFENIQYFVYSAWY